MNKTSNRKKEIITDSQIELLRAVFISEKYSKGQAILELLFITNNFGDCRNFKTTVMFLSERWRWSRNKVNNFLRLLEENNIIHVERLNKGIVIKCILEEGITHILSQDIWGDKPLNEDEKVYLTPVILKR